MCILYSICTVHHSREVLFPQSVCSTVWFPQCASGSLLDFLFGIFHSNCSLCNSFFIYFAQCVTVLFAIRSIKLPSVYNCLLGILVLLFPTVRIIANFWFFTVTVLFSIPHSAIAIRSLIFLSFWIFLTVWTVVKIGTSSFLSYLLFYMYWLISCFTCIDLSICICFLCL